MKKNTPEFEELAAFQAGGRQISTRRGEADRIAKPLRSEFVSGNYFSTFGVGAFAGRFAPLTQSYARGREGDALVSQMHRGAEVPSSVRNLGDRWHADQSSRETPNMGVALYCLEAPRYGGDTLFASLCAAE